MPPDVTLSPSPLREPRRIVPGVPGDCVLNPEPLLSLRLQPLPSHLESTHPRSSPPPQTLHARGKVSCLPEKVFSPASNERPGWLSPPRGAQLPLLPPLPARRGPVQPQVLSGASPQSRWRRSSRTRAGDTFPSSLILRPPPPPPTAPRSSSSHFSCPVLIALVSLQQLAPHPTSPHPSTPPEQQLSPG